MAAQFWKHGLEFVFFCPSSVSLGHVILCNVLIVFSITLEIWVTVHQ